MYRERFFTNEEKQGLLEGFREWLLLQNYEITTIKYGPDKVELFIDWCNENKVREDHVSRFFEYLRKRKSSMKPGALSQGTLRVYLRILRLFKRFLQEVGHADLKIDIIFKGHEINHYEILTRKEIEKLYKLTNAGMLGMRDRAMLGVYYGCGLRRNEGASLQVSDIMPDKCLLYVRKGKNYQQRYVPMIGKSKIHILEYLRIARPALLAGNHGEYFFVGYTGKKLNGPGLYARLKKLIKQAGINKQCGLHSLRHSLATHLLENGMGMSKIAKLLGHKSLDSTQIYTHIKAQNGKGKEV